MNNDIPSPLVMTDEDLINYVYQEHRDNYLATQLATRLCDALDEIEALKEDIAACAP